MDRDQALRLVYDAIEVVNRQLPASRRLAKSLDTVIVGPSGSLDSLGLINFVITLEERVTDALTVPVELLDSTGKPDRSVWNADALLSETAPGVTLSTNRILLRNGLGTGLVTVSGSGDFQLQVAIGSIQTNRLLRDVSAEPRIAVGGTLAGSASVPPTAMRGSADTSLNKRFV